MHKTPSKSHPGYSTAQNTAISMPGTPSVQAKTGTMPRQQKISLISSMKAVGTDKKQPAKKWFYGKVRGGRNCFCAHPGM
ncbi:hypothetical protein ACWA06_10580 [Serratia rhizosphaerae]